MIKPEDIVLYPMNDDITGRRPHEEYVEDMARMFVNISVGYRLDYPTMKQLVEYAEQNHNRLNRGT